MNLGCNTVLFGGFDLNTALKYIKWCGYDGVELACIPGMAEHVTVDMSSEELANIRRAIDESGLILNAIEAACNLSDPEARAWFIRVLDVAKELGVPIVTSGSGGEQTEDGFRTAVAAVQEVSDAAAERGLKVAIKPHVNIAICDTEAALKAIDAVDSPGFGINFDPTHLFRQGDDPAESARKLGDAIIHAHVRDNLGTDLKVAPPEYQVAGKGSLNLPEVLVALKEIGYDGAMDLEIIGAKDYELAQVTAIAAESRGYFNRCLQELGWESTRRSE